MKKTLESVLFFKDFYHPLDSCKIKQWNASKIQKIPEKKTHTIDGNNLESLWKKSRCKIESRTWANLEFLGFSQAPCDHIWYPFLFQLFSDFSLMFQQGFPLINPWIWILKKNSWNKLHKTTQYRANHTWILMFVVSLSSKICSSLEFFHNKIIHF